MGSLIDLLKKRAVIAGGAALVAFAAGSGSGYYYAQKKLSTKFDELLEAEVKTAHEFYKSHFQPAEEFLAKIDVEIKADAQATVAGVVAAAEALDKYLPTASELAEGETPRTVQEPLGAAPRVLNRNVWEQARNSPTVDFDYQDEVDARRSDIPYIISAEEFENGTFQRACLTFYEGDDTLADAEDTEIAPHDVPQTVGSLANLRFGHRSDNNDTVYIRSEILDMDFEVARSGGSYSQEVAGFMPDDEPSLLSGRTFQGSAE